jgi:molybdopterin biosynthesis enzyme
MGTSHQEISQQTNLFLTTWPTQLCTSVRHTEVEACAPAKAKLLTTGSPLSQGEFEPCVGQRNRPTRRLTQDAEGESLGVFS